MKEQLFDDVYDEQLAEGAIINERHPGFKEDYLVLHCLLRKLKPISVMEVGTHTGYGTMIIKNAVPDATVYTLDLSDEQHYKSMQHPKSEGKRGEVGHECLLPFIQLWGDSTEFDFSQYPCEAYFVDAEHSYNNVFIETEKILLCKPKIIVYHDTDAINVYNAIVDAFRGNNDYDLFRVTDTRISYCLRKDIAE